MGLACKISFKKNGEAVVTDNFGNPSQLYDKVLAIAKDQEVALDMWATAYTEDFQERGESVTVDELLTHFDANMAEDTRLTNSEMVQVKDYMRRNGFERLSDLDKAMTKIFKKNGQYDINTKEAIKSELFTQDELESLDHKKVSKLLSSIQGHLSVEDFSVDPSFQDNYFKHGEHRDVFGSKERLSQEEVDKMITDNIESFTDKADLLVQLRKLPFQGIADKFEKSPTYAKNLADKIQSFKRVPVLEVVNGELTDQNKTHYVNIKNTMLAESDTTGIEADLMALTDIDADIWHQNHSTVSELLKEVEKELIDAGIDAIGLHKNVHSRKEIIEFVADVVNLLKQPNTANLNSLATSMENLIPQPTNIKTYTLDTKYSGLNIVEVHSRETKGDLFNKYGLIEVGENLYHKVDHTASLDTVLEAVETKVVSGDIVLPTELITKEQLEDVEAVKEAVSNYIASKRTIDGLNNNDLYAAYQVFFDHNPLPNKSQDVKYLAGITTNTNYLKGEFVVDFHRYILQEKFKNSPIYRSTLSKFRITDQDITLDGVLDSIEGIKYEKKLSDYFALSRDSNANHLILEKESAIDEDMVAINFPETVKEFQGAYKKDSGYVLADTQSKFIKVDGKLYREALAKEGVKLFAEINSRPDQVYYSNSDNFNFNKTEAMGVMNNYNSLKNSRLSTEEVNNLKESENINIENSSTVLESGLKVLPLYTKEQKAKIDNEIDNCAG